MDEWNLKKYIETMEIYALGGIQHIKELNKSLDRIEDLSQKIMTDENVNNDEWDEMGDENEIFNRFQDLVYELSHRL